MDRTLAFLPAVYKKKTAYLAKYFILYSTDEFLIKS